MFCSCYIYILYYPHIIHLQTPTAINLVNQSTDKNKEIGITLVTKCVSAAIMATY